MDTLENGFHFNYKTLSKFAKIKILFCCSQTVVSNRFLWFLWRPLSVKFSRLRRQDASGIPVALVSLSHPPTWCKWATICFVLRCYFVTQNLSRNLDGWRKVRYMKESLWNYKNEWMPKKTCGAILFAGQSNQTHLNTFGNMAHTQLMWQMMHFFSVSFSLFFFLFHVGVVRANNWSRAQLQVAWHHI